MTVSVLPMLGISIVPAPCRYNNLRAWLLTRWERLRDQCFDAAGHVCEICGRVGPKWAPVEAHESWSFDVELGPDSCAIEPAVQRFDGLQALCPACHEVKHIGLAIAKGRGTLAVNHLCDVNGWTFPQGQAYVDECFEMWSFLSSIETWRYDLRVLLARVPKSDLRPPLALTDLAGEFELVDVARVADAKLRRLLYNLQPKSAAYAHSDY